MKTHQQRLKEQSHRLQNEAPRLQQSLALATAGMNFFAEAVIALGPHVNEVAPDFIDSLIEEVERFPN